MNFMITRSNLLEALTVAGRCIGAGKNIMPILDYFKLDIDSDKLIVTGSSMDIFIEAECPIESNHLQVSLCLPAQRLSNLIKELPEQPLMFELKEVPADEALKRPAHYRVKIKTSVGEYILPSEDADNFPEIKHKSKGNFDIGRAMLSDGLNRTLFACFAGDDGSSMTCASVELENNKVTFTGTDRHILSTFSIDTDVNIKKHILVPAKVMSTLMALPLDVSVNVSIDDGSIRFQVNEDTLMTAILFSGQYPDYRAVIPRKNNNSLNINRTELIGALKRVSTFTNRVTFGVKISLNDNRIVIEGEDIDYGENGREELACTYTGEKLAIGLNARNLVNCLNKIQTDSIWMFFNDYRTAVVVRDDDKAGETSNLMLALPLLMNLN